MSLYLFDLDGTLIKSYLEKQPCDDDECRGGAVIEDGRPVKCVRCNGRGHHLRSTQPYSTIEWLPNRLRRLRLVYRHNEIGIVTNQTGVTWGYQTLSETEEKMDTVRTMVADYISVGAEHVPISYCTDAYDDYRRKPGPGMIDELRERLGYPNWDTTYVGDMETDRKAAKAARVAYIDAEDFFHRFNLRS